MRHLRPSLSSSFLSSSFAVALLSAAVLAAPRAEACSPAAFQPRLLEGETQPAAGAVDVPTNARIFFASSGGDLVNAPVATVQRGDDEPTAATIEIVPGGFVLTGVVLEPLTTYTAHLDLVEVIEDPVTGETSAEPGTSGEIVFTTGEAADTTPPTWDGDAVVDTAHVAGSSPFEWFFPSTCGLQSAFDIHTITPPAVAEDVAVIELRLVEVDGEAIVVDAAAPGTPLEDRIFDEVSVRYELVAIDVAGNESDPLFVQAAASGGCSATDENDAGAAAVVTVALALLRRRRRA
jgi:uncharacterized protein (TIGR03382 family)